MKYYSEEQIRDQFDQFECEAFFKRHDNSINVRRCCECEYFINEHPTIDTNNDFGYCEYRTDFNALEEGWPINWYFTDINGFCDENDIR